MHAVGQQHMILAAHGMEQAGWLQTGKVCLKMHSSGWSRGERVGWAFDPDSSSLVLGMTWCVNGCRLACGPFLWTAFLTQAFSISHSS